MRKPFKTLPIGIKHIDKNNCVTAYYDRELKKCIFGTYFFNKDYSVIILHERF